VTENEEQKIGHERGYDRRIRRWLVWLTAALLIPMVIAGLANPSPMERLILHSTPTPILGPTWPPPKAPILDQTSRTDLSSEFIEKARDYLCQAGYEVEVYPWEKLTVDFYRTLPLRGCQLILFQTDSTSQAIGPAAEGRTSVPFIFTGEEASRRYLVEQLQDRIRLAKFFYGDFPPFLAIRPAFVRFSMSGSSSGTVIIIGGCQSLATGDLAQAFLDRGASLVIGWDGLVDLSLNNEAVLQLLKALALEGLSPHKAVEETRERTGSDPAYGSILCQLP